MEKVGLLGGTFDPIHSGHIQLALTARAEGQLDRVVLIPAGDPPHKESTDITPYHHRLEMVRIAIRDHGELSCSDMESGISSPSYTIDTIRRLQRSAIPSSRYFFIIGIDAFLDIRSWKSYRELLSRVNLLVASRQGYSDPQLSDELRSSLGYTRDGTLWRGAAGLQDVLFLKSPIDQVSSSEIRLRLASGVSEAPGAIDGKVLSYIAEHRLYSQ